MEQRIQPRIMTTGCEFPDFVPSSRTEDLTIRRVRQIVAAPPARLRQPPREPPLAKPAPEKAEAEMFRPARP